MGAYKKYNIQIKGKVQDIGFRNLVENIARSLNLRGMVYNDVDGTVKIVCQGAVSSVKSLIEEIRSKSSNVGASVEEVSQKEIQEAIFLPPIFFKAPTDELSDISRKLDIGIQSIQGVETNTHALIGGQEKMVKLLEKNTQLLENNTQPIQNIERNTQALIDGQERIEKNTRSMIDGQERIEKNTHALIGGQEKMVKLLEKIAEK